MMTKIYKITGSSEKRSTTVYRNKHDIPRTIALLEKCGYQNINIEDIILNQTHVHYIFPNLKKLN